MRRNGNDSGFQIQEKRGKGMVRDYRSKVMKFDLDIKCFVLVEECPIVFCPPLFWSS